MKKLVKNILSATGYEIKKVSKVEVGSDRRPVGQMDLLIEDLKKRGLKCNFVLDIGANKTSWSRMVVKIFPYASFFLVEPQVEMTSYLVDFCKEHINSDFFLAGAGSKNGLMTLTIWDDLEGSSVLPKPDESLLNIGKQREIEIITIDELIDSSQIELPELIKIDIQGYELEALKGAKKTFGYTEVFILEVSLFSPEDMPNVPSISDVINFMLDRDYVVYDFPGFLRRPSDGALGQCDICFVKKEGFLRTNKYWN